MKAEIKNAAIELLANSEPLQWNYLNHGRSFASDYTVCHAINFDLDYWEEDVMTSDIKEIIAAVDSRLAEMDLKAILLAA